MIRLVPSRIPAAAPVSRLHVVVCVIAIEPLILALLSSGIVVVSTGTIPLAIFTSLSICIQAALVLTVASILASLRWSLVTTSGV